ncbi:MAG: DUF3566 domain-containing protein [Anaerolineae bacterium]|nr:DUF3566 domain-containing protein [Anaerolineae bacterium]
MVTVKKIDIASAFRVGALVSGLISLVVLAIFVLFQATIFSSLMSMSASVNGQPMPSSASSFLGAASVASICLFYGCGVVIQTIVGGITAALGAFFYNIVANQFGGLQVQLTGEVFEQVEASKQKNAFFDADFEA